jgi:ligand-binding sensor protein
MKIRISKILKENRNDYNIFYRAFERTIIIFKKKYTIPCNMPKKRSDLALDLETAVKGHVYRCHQCNNAYVITGLELNMAGYVVRGRNLTTGEQETRLLTNCTAYWLNKEDSLTPSERKNLTKYQRECSPTNP